MKYNKEEVEEALQDLKRMLPVGTKIYTRVMAVAKSGMSRTMKTYYVNRGGEIVALNWYICLVMGEPMQKDGSIRVHGCGMDMGFHLVYSLSRRLFPDGFAVKDQRHAESLGETVGSKQDGGYALKQVWL